jgi:hypothetical protein
MLQSEGCWENSSNFNRDIRNDTQMTERGDFAKLQECNKNSTSNG